MATDPSTRPRIRGRRESELSNFIQHVSPEADPTSVLLFRQMLKANQLLTHAAEKQLEMAGLSWAKFRMLLELLRDESYGGSEGLQPSELSDVQGIRRNSVSTLIASLEQEGLVSRELHDTDRRKFVIRLTPQGRKALKSRLSTQFVLVTECFAAFRPEERATLLELLTRLTRSLSKADN